MLTAILISLLVGALILWICAERAVSHWQREALRWEEAHRQAMRDASARYAAELRRPTVDERADLLRERHAGRTPCLVGTCVCGEPVGWDDQTTVSYDQSCRLGVACRHCGRVMAF